MPTGAQTRAALATVGGGMMSVGGGINIGTLVGHVVADISGLTKGISKATKHLQGFSARMDTFLKKNAASMRRIGFQVAAVGTAVVAGVGAMVKTYGEFERRMRRATAVSDVSEKQFLEMSRMAEAESVKLNIAATGAADAFYYLGSAGLSATEQMAAFPAVALMSKAAVIDLKFSADMMVGTMKAYRKSFNETAEVTDIFTEAVTSSNMTFSDLGETLALTAAIGKRTNNSIADLTAMIGLMADTNIKGSRAGTSLRRALLNLAAPSSEVRMELAKWEVDVYDAERKMKPFVQIIGEFGGALKNATEEQKNLAFKTLFGVRAITGQLAIFDLGVEKVQAFVDQLNNAGGASERVAKKQMKAFMEQIGRVGKETRRLAHHIGMSLAPAISNLADRLMPMVDGMTEWVDANEELTLALTATAAGMGTVALVGGTLTMGLAALAIAASGLGVTVAGLGLTITAVTLGIGVFAGAVVYAVARVMKMRKEIELLKRDMEFDDPLKGLEDLMIKLRPLMAAGVEEGDRAFDLLYKNWRELKKLEGDMGKALDATRSELLEMARQYKLQKPSMLILTRTLRASVLRELVTLRDMYSEMASLNTQAVKRMLDRTDDLVEDSIEKQMTMFEVASEERKREREDEYNDWRIKTEAWAGQWTEMEYKRIQATRNAIDDMHDATTDFLTESLVDFGNWRENIINFLKDIQRAIARAFATRIAEEIMATSTAQFVMGSLLGGVGAGVPKTTQPPTQMQLATVPHAEGGIATRPHIGIFGERPEAFVPLPDGRTIPVTMAGGGVPNVEVNVINRTSTDVGARRGSTRFDSRGMITEVILTDIVDGGPISGAITNLRG